MIELELKAVVKDAAALRARLLAAGAVAGFAGLMEDRRFDRGTELLARGETLRTRRFLGPEGARALVTWKGPVSVDRGYKRRRELEVEVRGDALDDLLEALGFRVMEAIDRFVEYFTVGGATVRIEWYPRMDVLVEIEGSPDEIERAVGLTGIPRSEFQPHPLPVFVARFEERGGQPAATSVAALGGERPAWPAR